MKHSIDDVRGHLFTVLERLQDNDNPMDIDRAKTIAQVAGVLVDTARVEVDFCRVTGGTGSGFMKNTGWRQQQLKSVGGRRDESI